MVFTIRAYRNIFMLIVFLSAVGCKDKKESDTQSTEAVEKISLRQAWFTWAGYAGEIEATKLDKKYGIDITVEQGADDIDPVKLILSGQNDIGITSAEALLLANEKGADLVAIGVINYKSPTVYVSLKGKGILNLKDFENKRVGILTGSETETIYRLLMKENDINTSGIREIEAAYDLASFLVTDSYDIRPAFVFDELITLDDKNIEYNSIYPEDYGVSIMGAIYFTTRKMIEEKPKLVQNFVNAIAEGWEKTIQDPKASIDLLSGYDDKIDEERELKSLIKGLDYFKGQDNKVLFVDENAWENMANVLVKTGKSKEKLDYRKSFDNKFINNYHANKQ